MRASAIAALVVLATTAGTVWAAGLEPPRAKPMAVAPPQSGPDAPVEPSTRALKPRAKPEVPQPGSPGAADGAMRPDAPAGEPEATTAALGPDEADPPPAPVDGGALAACERELAAMGAEFNRADPIEGDFGCGVAAPLKVRKLAPTIAVRPDGALTCEAALATARWVHDVVLPAAKVFGEDVRLADINLASTYVCRSRNHQSGAKLSEHAKGTAIDIAGFDFEGRGPIGVAERPGTGSLEESFQRAVRGGACLHFTTVLGPGSDPYHADHLHLDVKQRSGGFRLCQ